MKNMILGFCVFMFFVLKWYLQRKNKKKSCFVFPGLCSKSSLALTEPKQCIVYTHIFTLHTCTSSNPNMLHMLQSNPKMFPQKVILTCFHKMVPTCSPEHNPSYPDMLAPTHRIIADRKTPVESFFCGRFTFRIINYWLTGSGRITGEHEINFN